jgi:glycerol-3-phosphate dehydrogenase
MAEVAPIEDEQTGEEDQIKALVVVEGTGIEVEDVEETLPITMITITDNP